MFTQFKKANLREICLAIQKEELNKQTLWSAKQRNHLRRLIAQGATIAYVCTDAHGMPANGGPNTSEWQVYPGCVQKVKGPLRLCGKHALHGTFEPHRWKGTRVWVAGFLGEVKCEEGKLGSLHREIVGEVFPETALSDSVGARLGRKDLQGADLQYANLWGARLQSASLQYANLQGARLQYADLQYANLWGARLQSADLQYANLWGARLQSANLQGADLQHANLQHARLWGAYLPNAKNIPELAKYGWINDKYGYLMKK